MKRRIIGMLLVCLVAVGPLPGCAGALESSSPSTIKFPNGEELLFRDLSAPERVTAGVGAAGLFCLMAGGIASPWIEEDELVDTGGILLGAGLVAFTIAAGCKGRFRKAVSTAEGPAEGQPSPGLKDLKSGDLSVPKRVATGVAVTGLLCLATAGLLSVQCPWMDVDELVDTGGTLVGAGLVGFGIAAACKGRSRRGAGRVQWGVGPTGCRLSYRF